jgi:predicted phage baseplate assembly protein
MWWPKVDLLGSSGTDPHFVVEMDDARRAHLRFGNGELGAQPPANDRFCAMYRVGNGPAGNVGAETISHVVLTNPVDGLALTPRNPLPARGGTPPETVAEVKLFAPHAFRRRLERAITAADYAAIVMRDFPHKVQRATAVLRWMGGWYELLVAVDPRQTTEPDPALLDEIAAHLYRYRRIGHDLVVQPATYVPLDIALDVCVLPHFLRGHVKAALLAAFSSRRLPDGRTGFFHPDNLSFGEGVFLSRLVAAAQAVPGVESVAVTKLQRLFAGPNDEIKNGVLPLGLLEVARLDSDPSFPENGRFTLNLGGGR